MNAEDIYRIRFSKPRVGRRGYQRDEVDAFLDVIAGRLKLRNHLTAEEVHRIAFERAPVDQGYDTDEVDHFLNRVEAVLAGNRQKTSQHARTCEPVTSSPDQPSPDRHRGNRNRAAVVSLGASILGFTLVGIVVAILSGVIAFITIRRTHQRGRAFVVAGLVISAAWVALIFVWLHIGHPNPFHPSTANRRSLSGTTAIQGKTCSAAIAFGQQPIIIFGSDQQFDLGI